MSGAESLPRKGSEMKMDNIKLQLEEELSGGVYPK